MSYVRSIIDELRKELASLIFRFLDLTVCFSQDSVRVPVDLLAACPQRQGIDQNGQDPSLKTPFV